MISTLFVVAANVAILTMPHSSPQTSSRPSIDLQCYDMGTTDGVQELRCYRKLAETPVDDGKDPSGWWCKPSFHQASQFGPRLKLYCADRTGNHKLVFGDFIR